MRSSVGRYSRSFLRKQLVYPACRKFRTHSDTSWEDERYDASRAPCCLCDAAKVATSVLGCACRQADCENIQRYVGQLVDDQRCLHVESVGGDQRARTQSSNTACIDGLADDRHRRKRPHTRHGHAFHVLIPAFGNAYGAQYGLPRRGEPDDYARLRSRPASGGHNVGTDVPRLRPNRLLPFRMPTNGVTIAAISFRYVS